MTVDPYAGVVGQSDAVARLRVAAATPVPAYLFVGPAGSGMRRIARIFAGELLAGGDDGHDGDRHRRLAAVEEHPDFVVVERDGAFISAEQARDAAWAASTSPVDAACKVVMLVDLHLIREGGPMLLKAVEEPPPTTIFLLLAEEIPPELATMESRCVRVDFGPLDDESIRVALLEAGVDAELASFSAAASGGSYERASLLAEDDGALARWEMWSELPNVLDGTGSTVADAVDLITRLLDEAAAPLEARHERERDELDARAEQFGERGLGRTSMVERHRRELRRLRADELMMGLTALGRRLRSDLVEARRDPSHAVRALAALDVAAEAVDRNANERLLLDALLFELVE